MVGQNVPFVTGSSPTPARRTCVNPFQTIERKDVGITLRIKPQIGESGTVRMTIYQEASSVATSTAVGTDNAGPTTNKRSIESTIVVDDGQIIVLGGLIEDKYDTTPRQGAAARRHPVLGALFRSENRTRKKTNLMVFLRPVVMRDQAASERDLAGPLRLHPRAAAGIAAAAEHVLPINEAPVLPPIRRRRRPAERRTATARRHRRRRRRSPCPRRRPSAAPPN